MLSNSYSRSAAFQTVVFYNVENLFLPDSSEKRNKSHSHSGLNRWNRARYENKLYKLANVFHLIEQKYEALPVLIGFSEVQGKLPVQDLLAHSVFKGEYDVVHFESLDERGMDVALAFHTKTIEVIESQPLVYFFGDNFEGNGRADTTRDVLWVKIKWHFETVHVFVVHLPSKRENDINKAKRAHILNELKERIHQLSGSDERVLVMGDFNENPLDDLMTDFLQMGDESILFNPFGDVFKAQNYSVFHYRQGLLFDQILLSQHFLQQDKGSLHLLQAEVFRHQEIENWDKRFKGRPFRTYAGTRYLGGYSDHYPVLVKLGIKDIP